MGSIHRNFLDDGFNVTYDDGIVERFHKNLLDNNYKGDKGSSIVGHFFDDGFTVKRYDGSQERFYKNVFNDNMTGSNGTQIRKNFWGDGYVTDNPYADYNLHIPTTIAEAKKNKYQETPLRIYQLDKTSGICLEDIRVALQEVIDAADLPLAVLESNAIGTDAVAIVSRDNLNYMPVYTYLSNAGGVFGSISSVAGKGEQTKSTDLEKMFYKAASPWGKFQMKAEKGRAWSQYFGYSVRSAGAVGGAAALTGMAIGGTYRLVAKGVKALLRDSEAYQKEMNFYTQATGVIDFAIGYIDSEYIIDNIFNRAEEGNSLAQYYVGTSYVYGIGVTQNEEMAFEWFIKAAENGELRSQNIVSGEYLYNNDKEYSKKEKEKGIDYLYNLASFGETWAGQLLIDIYGRGSVQGIDLDYDEAIRIARIYAEYDPLYAAQFLAPIFDSQSPVFSRELERYKNDYEAFEQYNIILRFGDKEECENAAMKLAAMALEGRGTEKSTTRAIDYYKEAAGFGNLEAKHFLLNAFTFGEGTVASKDDAVKYAKEIIISGNKAYVPDAYYSLFLFADMEKQYGESMKQAQNYIDCENVNLDKKEELYNYLSDMRARISQMTDEERRDFLKEPKKFSLDLKTIKWIAIGCAIVLAIIIGVTAFNHIQTNDDSSYNGEDYGKTNEDTIAPGVQKHPENEDTVTSDNQKHSEEATAALKAYNDLLTGGTFNRNGFDRDNVDRLTEEWDPENCQFNVSYIDEDDVPELALYNPTDSDHASGFGQIYTYEDGQIVSAARVSSFYADAVGEVAGYYKETGYYTDFAMWQGSGSLNMRSINNPEDYISINYEASDDTEAITGYSIRGEECTKEDYFNRLKVMVGTAEFTAYEFYDNNDSNREIVLGLSERGDSDSIDEEDTTIISSEEEATEYLKSMGNFPEGDTGDFNNVKIGCNGFNDGYYIVRVYNDMENHISTLGLYGITKEGYIYDMMMDEWVYNEDGWANGF